MKTLTIENLKKDFSNSEIIEKFNKFVSSYSVSINLYFKKIDSNSYIYGTFDDFFNKNIDFDIYGKFWFVETEYNKVYFCNLNYDSDSEPTKDLNSNDFDIFFNKINLELLNLNNEIIQLQN